MTVSEIPEIGFCGGMLLLNQWGRPLEFHCSAPILPNRTQEILFGHTLRPYLFCEQIGSALLEQTKQSPIAIFIDQTTLLDLYVHTQWPVVLVGRDTADSLSPTQSGNAMFHQVIDGWRLWGAGDSQSWEQVQAACRSFVEQLPLDEPFERIRGAILEAQATAVR